jgi:hypothetical protein
MVRETELDGGQTESVQKATQAVLGLPLSVPLWKDHRGGSVIGNRKQQAMPGVVLFVARAQRGRKAKLVAIESVV